MRKTLLGLMTLLMLTPVLACAMTFCPMQAAQAAEPEPCHETQDKDKGAKLPMLVLDCMNVDLFQQDMVVDYEIEQQADISFSWADLTTDYGFLKDQAHVIRGPPDEWLHISQTQPSTILTTQRFRN
jgi:hypothetical protein